jgi:carboxypeptidase Q
MRRRRSPIRPPLALVLALAAMSSSPAQDRADFERIRSAAFEGDGGAAVLRELCDRIGQRLTGGPGHALAVERVAARLEALGLAVVRDRDVIPQSWQRAPLRARLLAPIARELAAAAGPWTTGFPTPRTLRIVSPSGEAPTAADAVLLDPRELALGPRPAHPFPAAGALLVDSLRPHALLAADLATFAAPFVAADVPAVFLSSEDMALLRRLREDGEELRIELAGGGSVGGEVAVHELVAAIPGVGAADGDTSGELVLAFCGLDSWDLGTGATADGAGVAVLVEAARILRSLERAPARAIRFAFLSGTAQGAGSSRYAQRRVAELPRHRVAFAIEGGAGRLLGLMLDGVREDLDRAETWFEPVRSLGATDVGYRGPRTNLTRALRERGVRAYAFVQQAPDWGVLDGTAADTYDKVLVRELQEAACVLATVLWSAANEAG